MRLKIDNSVIQRKTNEPFIDHLVTCNEIWVDYNSRQFVKPAGTIPTPRGTLHSEYLPMDQKIN